MTNEPIQIRELEEDTKRKEISLFPLPIILFLSLLQLFS